MDTPLVDAPRPARKARYTLQRPVIDAPAIGEKISAQLEAIGASTIGDLLAADADALSARLANARHTPAIIRDWRR
jgi:nucleotidyltransferase/DNA polymerase involved in DNA repair